MKKLRLFILFVLLLPVTNSFAASVASLTYTGQKIFIPYAQVGIGYWSGVAIHNTSDSTMNFSIGVYKDDGTWVTGSTFSVPSHAMKVDLLERFFVGHTPPSQMMSPVIMATVNVPFQATLFIGNIEGGIGFQNYTSSDWIYSINPVLP